jgi:NAD(P)-dependent dehydrogenase (short-subunit alcohol dehydrogenase family)
MSQACLPYLEKSSNAHILNLSPPISLDPKWLQSHVAYTISKYGMSMCTIGMAAEFRDRGISVNSLWPRTAIATAAISMLMGEDSFAHCRKPEIVADAAYALFCTTPLEVTGQLLIDDDFLRTRGVTDFEPYACQPGQPLQADFYVD